MKMVLKIFRFTKMEAKGTFCFVNVFENKNRFFYFHVNVLLLKNVYEFFFFEI